MSEERDPIVPLDPADTLHQAGALAEHLQRLGAQWLPTPIAENVERYAANFAAGLADPSSTDVESTAIESADVGEGPTTPESAATDSAKDNARTRSAGGVNTKSSSPSPAFTLSADADTSQPYPGAALATEQRSVQLQQYAEQVSQCTRCELLVKCRTKTVFGEGNPNPRVVFFGEGPGRDEDVSGRPFVGKAGQLLTKMIAACTFEREDVYIMNTVKCRPPNNRNPEPAEIENCREYFEAQLNILRPEYIVCLGLVSAQALLQTKQSVGRLRGKFHSYFDSKVLVTYHPAYLLRTPAAKKAAWEDLQIMLRDAGLI